MLKTIIGFIIVLSAISGLSQATAMEPDYLESVKLSYGRGIEIRYTKVELKPGEALPREITIDDVKYPLYKTKEEAVTAVKNSAIRKDLTVVYVLSEVEKDTEKFDISE